MEIILNDRIKVRRHNKIKFDCDPAGLSYVAVMGGRNHEFPRMFRWLASKICLQYIILKTENNEITVAYRDTGFHDLIGWLGARGWQTAEAVRQALREPYIRIPIPFKPLV